MQPSAGRIVHYTLTEQDAADINRRRDTFHDSLTATDRPRPRDIGRDGSQGHIGNHAEPGQTFPAIIVRQWSTNPDGPICCNLQVMLDGTDVLWATSRHHGDQPGTWAWPPRT